MKTIEKWAMEIPQIPTATVWMLNDLAEYKGKQELFTRQSPQRLRALREHALIESAVCSNRIEGVLIDQKRIGTVLFGQGHLQDRDEEEVRGYQEALSWIHQEKENIPLVPETILKLHQMTRPNIWDSGKYKKDDGEIIEKHSDGRITIRFKPLSAQETPDAIKQLCRDTDRMLKSRETPALVALAAFNLDFLCIHPFRDGNGRVSRLLLLLLMYHLGFNAGRYISLERIIEQSKDRYYETLKQSSDGWHQSRHNPWPYINYLLHSIKMLYREFEDRFENTTIPRGEKTESVRKAILSFSGAFHINELLKECPDTSIDMIRKILRTMRDEGLLECTGRGKQALWKGIR
jgi:Fic family protein